MPQWGQRGRWARSQSRCCWLGRGHGHWGGSSWPPLMVQWPPAGLPAPACASSSGVVTTASMLLLSGAVSSSVPRAEASLCGFLASDTLHPYCPAAPEARTPGTPSQPLGGSRWGPSPPASPDPSTLRAATSFRPHANGIFSERPFLISLSKVRTFFSHDTYRHPLLYFPYSQCFRKQAFPNTTHTHTQTALPSP